jgi:hypothetical protein
MECIHFSTYYLALTALLPLFSALACLRSSLLLSSDTTLYNPAVNKRARKRLKEAIEKKNLERQKMLKEQSSASSQTKERRGFTVKPEKKRG